MTQQLSCLLSDKWKAVTIHGLMMRTLLDVPHILQ